MSNCRSGRRSELFQASIADVVALIGDALREVWVPYAKKICDSVKLPSKNTRPCLTYKTVATRCSASPIRRNAALTALCSVSLIKQTAKILLPHSDTVCPRVSPSLLKQGVSIHKQPCQGHHSNRFGYGPRHNKVFRISTYPLALCPQDNSNVAIRNARTCSPDYCSHNSHRHDKSKFRITQKTKCCKWY